MLRELAVQNLALIEDVRVELHPGFCAWTGETGAGKTLLLTALGLLLGERGASELIRAGVRVRRTNDVHDKYFLAYGKFGGRYQHQVYTGSQNWSGSALTTNDEIFVKLAPESPTSHPVYDAFSRHFADAWLAGRACSRSSYPCR